MLTFRLLAASAAAGVAAAVLLLAAPGAPGALAAPGAPGGLAAPGSRSQPASPGPAATSQLLRDVQNAWKITQGSGVTVAVLSTGVDPSAVGLAGKVMTGHDYVNLPFPAPLDGTLIASAVAGSGPTGTSPIGPIGRAPQARILSIRIWPDAAVPGATAWDKSDSWDDIIGDAITEAVRRGAKVIFVDETGYGGSLTLEQGVQSAISRNVVVVSEEQGFGRDPNAPMYPTSLPGVLGAGSVFLSGLPPVTPEVATPKNESILVSAPGNPLLASGPQGPGYFVQNSYSSAAWIVGTAALIKSVYPDLPPALVAQAIALSARDHPRGGYNTTVGFGLINPAGALQEASALAKLSNTAAPGPGVASPSARLAVEPAPGIINAVHHSTAKLAGFAVAIAFGIACLVLVALLARRWRRRPAGASGATAA
jgi:hypothetical protein